ncbi:MAG TPA: poly(R)-hydroxyalkanoic acid synthase subunit PhaE [Nitrososphaeraceae archaeon]|nr:poly(R)-hydroxyalkanoic acid synthase subunit PhaE [Nitrososphaeraceae archaeon]
MTSDEQVGEEMRHGLEKNEELGKSMLGIWEEIFKLPTIGPLYSYFGNIKDENAQLANLTETIMKSQITLGQYWKQVNQAYVNAVLRINEKTSSSLLDIKTKKDLDDYRKLMIDSFEEEFTRLFNSKEFALTYRDLLDKQMDILKQIQASSQRTLGILNLPTRKEMDMISRDLHDLRKSVMDLNERLESTVRKMQS